MLFISLWLLLLSPFLLLLLLLCNADVSGRHCRSLNFGAEIRLEHYLPNEDYHGKRNGYQEGIL